MAVLGRIMACGALAFGWQRLSTAVVPQAPLAALSAGLLVGLNHWCQMAGEWVVGGFEAKGFAYALVFLAAGGIARNKWNQVWVFLGAATAFHVVIGGWSIVAAGLAWFWLGGDGQRPSVRDMLPGLAAALVLSAVGLWPALRLGQGVDPSIANQAAWIQVFRRLPHHLDPGRFFFAVRPPYIMWPAARFVCLAIVWAVVARQGRTSDESRRLTLLVGASLAIVAIGILTSIVLRHDAQLAARVLRFYWFRTADVLLPAGAAIALLQWVVAAGNLRPSYRLGWLAVVVLAGAVHLGYLTFARLADPRPAADAKFCQSVKQLNDWREVCDFVHASTPADATFITPRAARTFKWYAGRAEVVTWKEMPQDARSTVAWWARLHDIYRSDDRWLASLADLSPSQLQALGRKYQADFLVTSATPALALPVLHRNNSFAVYRLTPGDHSPAVKGDEDAGA
jgi:hypothetical protein